MPENDADTSPGSVPVTEQVQLTGSPRRDWKKTGEPHVPPRRRPEFLRLIEKLTWHEFQPEMLLPALPGLAIRATLVEFNLPNVTEITWDGLLERGSASYGLYGIEANYPNGRVRLYLLDIGTATVPVLCDFWATWATSPPVAASA
jgi:hypothetical protein